MKYSTLVTLICALSTSAAFAEHYHCDRPLHYRTVLARSMAYTSNACQVSVELTLTRGSHSFSFGNYVAEFWQGQYQRQAEVTETVRYNTYNCWGQLLSSETVTEATPFQVSFDIQNPNLRSDATWADMMAPMTDDEALAAYAITKQECESSKVPSL
ncbi:MAG: hypothetical protein ACJ763_04010 [Bdellovibrionia bacterium]